jgi:hypothetical protein
MVSKLSQWTAQTVSMGQIAGSFKGIPAVKFSGLFPKSETAVV